MKRFIFIYRTKLHWSTEYFGTFEEAFSIYRQFESGFILSKSLFYRDYDGKTILVCSEVKEA